MSNDPHKATGQALNQNHRLSDDAGDGDRKSAVLGRDGKATPAEKAPAQDEQDESAIEAFGEEGAGIAPKE
jgi:hypothetical protein